MKRWGSDLGMRAREVGHEEMGEWSGDEGQGGVA